MLGNLTYYRTSGFHRDFHRAQARAKPQISKVFVMSRIQKTGVLSV
jgi:hypothetical protein